MKRSFDGSAFFYCDDFWDEAKRMSVLLGQNDVVVDWAEMLMVLGTMVLLSVAIALTVVVIVLRFMEGIRRWKTGLVVGGVVLLLNLPMMLIVLVIASQAFEYPGLVMVIGVFMCVGISVWLLMWRMMVYGAGAASWARVHEGGYVILDKGRLGGRGRENAWRRVLWGFGIGGVFCLLTVVGFDLLGVESGEMMQMFAGDEGNAGERAEAGGDMAVTVLLLLSVVTTAAFGEELVFRGVLLPWLAELFGWKPGREMGFWLSVLVVSFLWSTIHWPNTNMPVVKLLQIFVVSLAFCWMARKWGVESAIAGHLGLNVPAVLFMG